MAPALATETGPRRGPAISIRPGHHRADMLRCMDVLTARDAGRIARIWNRAQPSEALTEGEIHRILHHDPGVVLTTGPGVVAATARAGRGHIRLLAVMPEVRHRGHGRALLDAAENWLGARGTTTLVWGGEIPYYLWPGLDQDWTAATHLALAAGYESRATAVNMTITTNLQAPPTLPVIQITGQDPRWRAVEEFVADNWQAWLIELGLAGEQGTLFVAFDGDRPVSFMAHSTLRQGWLGPMGTDAAYRGRGIGASVIQAACADLASRGFSTAQIAWVGPTDYFARLGATRSRTFLRLLKTAPDPAAAGN